jgi:hypothetical protein
LSGQEEPKPDEEEEQVEDSMSNAQCQLFIFLQNFFRISLCLIHFRFIFVSFHVFFAIFSRTQRETQPVGSPEAMGATLAGDKSSSSDDAETSEQKPFPKPFTSISSI